MTYNVVRRIIPDNNTADIKTVNTNVNCLDSVSSKNLMIGFKIGF